MKKSTSILLLIISFLSALSSTINVNHNGTGDYEKIQEAINNAMIGDTVVVWPGTYCENIDLLGKSLTITSRMLLTDDEFYKYNTIIDGNHSGACIAIHSNEESVRIYGLTIINGTGYDMSGYGDKNWGGGILLWDTGDIEITNCIIRDNFSNGAGGGLFCGHANLFLSGTSIFNNHTNGTGGGLFFGEDKLEFDPDNLCNMYLNFAERGSEIAMWATEETFHIYLDTCTVLNPDNYFFSMYNSFGHPIDNYEYHIQNRRIIQFDKDLYVNPHTGDDNNTGLSPSLPLKTIAFANTKIYVDPSNRNTIHLADGFYSDSANGEKFPINIKPHINITGKTRNETILDGNYTTRIFMGNNTVSDFKISKMTLQKGKRINYESSMSLLPSVVYCRYFNENATFDSLIIKDNYATTWGAFRVSNSRNTRITNCDFKDNKGGYALVVSFLGRSDTARIYNCNFINNEPDYEQYEHPYGRAIKIAGSGTSFIGNCLFTENGQIAIHYYYRSDNYLNNCTFVNNCKDLDGSAIWVYDASLRIQNCIFHDNGEWPLNASVVEANDTQKLHIYNSLFEGGIDAIGIYNEDMFDFHYDGTNIDTDPLFYGGPDFPFNLSNYSPCINSGANIGDFMTDLPGIDLAGNERLLFDTIDMGCYEWNLTVGFSENSFPVEQKYLKVFPNPTTGQFKIKIDKEPPKELQLLIKSMSGKIIVSKHFSASSEIYIDMSDQPAGIYVVHIEGEKFLEFAKIILTDK